jgi:hypothetical protein
MRSGGGSVTPPPDLFERLLRPLHQSGIPYMITGGLAAIIYGDPRLTNDVDLVVQLTPADAERLAAAFPSERYYAPPIETIREEAGRVAHGHFNLLDLETSLRADVYCLGEDELGAWAMERRRRVSIADLTIWVAPIEYVIVLKLRYYREAGSDRHLRDIAAMRRISGELIDASVLDDWIVRFGLEREWRKALETD